MTSVLCRLLCAALLSGALSACMGGDNNDSSSTGDGQDNPVEDSQGNGTDGGADVLPESGTDDVITEEPETP